jgi:hypothetical protein
MKFSKVIAHSVYIGNILDADVFRISPGAFEEFSKVGALVSFL